MSEFSLPELRERSVPAEAVAKIADAIGHLMLGWAFYDQALDHWIAAVFPTAMQRNIASKVYSNFDDRAELIRKCFARIPELAHLKSEVELFLQLGKDSSQVRNVVCHGTLSHFIAEPEPTVVFARVRYDQKAQRHVVRDDILPLSMIRDTELLLRTEVPAMHQLTRRIPFDELA